VHGGRRHVRQVDQHADPLHLADHRPAEVGQPARVHLVGGRIGPADVAVVGQGHVPDPECVQHPEHAEGSGDGVPALGAEEGGDPAGRGDPLDVRGGQGDLQRLRVARDDRARQVDLLEHGGDSRVPGEGGGHEHRPELRAHPAGREPGQIGVQVRDRCGQVDRGGITCAGRLFGAFAQRPGQVVMAVD